MITAFYCYNQTPMKASVENGSFGIISCNLRFAFDLASYTLDYIDSINKLANRLIFDIISFNFKNIPTHLHNAVIHHKMLLYRIIGCSIGMIPGIGQLCASYLYQKHSGSINKTAEEPKEIPLPNDHTLTRANFECITAPSKLTSIALKILQHVGFALFHMINRDPRSGLRSISDIRGELLKLPKIISEPTLHFIKACNKIIVTIFKKFNDGIK